MKKMLGLLGVALALVVGCISAPVETTKPAAATGAPGEAPIWASEAERPRWTVEEPEVDSGNLIFVGVAEKYATESGARDEALRNATTQVVRYLGTMAKSKYEKVATSYGLSTSVVDPTTSSREYEKQLAANVTKNVKARKWYIEKWNTNSGTGYKTFVMATVTAAAVNDSFKNTAKENMEEAQRKAKEAADEVGRTQADKAAKFWADMSKQGVVE